MRLNAVNKYTLIIIGSFLFFLICLYSYELMSNKDSNSWSVLAKGRFGEKRWILLESSTNGYGCLSLSASSKDINDEDALKAAEGKGPLANEAMCNFSKDDELQSSRSVGVECDGELITAGLTPSYIKNIRIGKTAKIDTRPAIVKNGYPNVRYWVSDKYTDGTFIPLTSDGLPDNSRWKV